MGEGVCDGSAHVKSCFFFLGGCFCSLARAGWALRTRQKLAFSFWAGTLVLWLGRAGRSAHVTNLLFLFGRVLWFSGSGGLGAPHTSQTCFFFLGGYFCSLTLACWALRTRHKLAFSFWAGTLVLWLGRAGCSAHVTNLLFLFGRVLPVLRSCLSRKIPFRHDPSRKKPPPHTHISHNRSLLTTQKPSPALRAGLGPKLPRLP